VSPTTATRRVPRGLGNATPSSAPLLTRLETLSAYPPASPLAGVGPFRAILLAPIYLRNVRSVPDPPIPECAGVAGYTVCGDGFFDDPGRFDSHFHPLETEAGSPPAVLIRFTSALSLLIVTFADFLTPRFPSPASPHLPALRSLGPRKLAPELCLVTLLETN
jgi:hypothetical protein